MTALFSVTGRQIPLPPEIRDKKTLFKHNKWLIENALDEAKANKDEHAELLIGNMNPKNFSQSDRDTAHEYLFGTVDDVLGKHPRKKSNLE